MLAHQPVTSDEAELNRQVLAIITSMTDVRSANELKIAAWNLFQTCYENEIEEHGGTRSAVFDTWMLFCR